MGMFDHIFIEGERAEKLASYCDINLESHMQTKQLQSTMTHYIITDNGIYERQYIREDTGKTTTYELFHGEDVEIKETVIIGEKRRQTSFVGELSFSAMTTDDEYARFTVLIEQDLQNGPCLIDIRPGESESGITNYGPWETTIYENPR